MTREKFMEFLNTTEDLPEVLVELRDWYNKRYGTM